MRPAALARPTDQTKGAGFMITKLMSVALLTLVFAATTSVAQARSHRANDAAWSARTSYQNYDPPWTFACIKDHGTSRCNDLN
jgi:hypothetical protein